MSQAVEGVLAELKEFSLGAGNEAQGQLERGANE